MDQTEIARIARDFAVITRITGPDPKSLKMRRRAFHLYQDGVTTLSSSGILLPKESLSPMQSTWEHDGDIIMTSASLIEPFLISEQRKNPTQELKPTLIRDAKIDVLVEGSKTEDNQNPCWIEAQLLSLVDVSASCLAILSLLGARAGSVENFSWDIGWSLASLNNNKQDGNVKRPLFNSETDFSQNESTPSDSAKSATRIAILGIKQLKYKRLLKIDVSQNKQGDSILVMGSPFGALAPLHFFNSVSIGVVANCLPPGSIKSSLLMVDVRCFPGMEGSIVLDKHASLVGMLISPLRQKGTDTEIQLVIPWSAIKFALDNRWKETQVNQKELIHKEINTINSRLSNSNYDIKYTSPLRKAISSIALITVNGSWASGVIINKQGLILTNAHLLEPWRFGNTSSLGLINKSNPMREEIGNKQSTKFNYTRFGKISVRLNCLENQIWCEAKVVYISKGPLDVALLKLEDFEGDLCKIDVEFECVEKGESVHVIGHGLIGPRSGLYPSVSSGVVSNVFTIQGPIYKNEARLIEKEMNKNTPIMLQTTAAVHPGSSGGAVVNSYGRLIGLITSNAKHGSGSNIPNMNFGIPCKSLEPIFKFSDKGEISILEQLDKPNELVSSVWALAPLPIESTLQKPQTEERNKQGSKFIEFLNERKDEIRFSKDLEHLLKKKLPSKI
ncbi:hypothetical protein LUZ60_001452 [Juncus effusus]|nr:hypothetical protein LUZ60_001452 [Juncus effusus]